MPYFLSFCFMLFLKIAHRRHLLVHSCPFPLRALPCARACAYACARALHHPRDFVCSKSSRAENLKAESGFRSANHLASLYFVGLNLDCKPREVVASWRSRCRRCLSLLVLTEGAARCQVLGCPSGRRCGASWRVGSRESEHRGTERGLCREWPALAM